MAENRVVRPSLKNSFFWYFLVTLILAGAAYWVYGYLGKDAAPSHAWALLLYLIPIKKHISTRTLSLTIEGDHVTLQTGLLSSTRRTVDLGKVQDVTARQSLGGRILGLGDLMVETAGERSAIVIEGIDRPREIADLILSKSRELARQRSHGV